MVKYKEAFYGRHATLNTSCSLRQGMHTYKGTGAV